MSLGEVKDQRRRYACKAVLDAMRVLSVKHPDIPFDDRPAHPICIVDWAYEAPGSAEQMEALEEAIGRYVDATGNDLSEVKTEYKKYAELHRRWWHGALSVEPPA